MLLFVLWIDCPCTIWSFAVALSEFLLLLPQDIAANTVLHLIKILMIKEFTTKEKLIFPKAQWHQDQIMPPFFPVPIPICLENRFLFIWTNMRSTLSYRQLQHSTEQMCLCHRHSFVATLLAINNRLKPSSTILVPVQFSCSFKETPFTVQFKVNWHLQLFSVVNYFPFMASYEVFFIEFSKQEISLFLLYCIHFCWCYCFSSIEW